MEKTSVTLKELFAKQMQTQEVIIGNGIYDDFAMMHDAQGLRDAELPFDDTGLFSYHVMHLLSELGEVLEADKRWKNFRNKKNEPEHKLEEFADCFIVLMNAIMFSGFTVEELEDVLCSKLDEVQARVMKEVASDNNR